MRFTDFLIETHSPEDSADMTIEDRVELAELIHQATKRKYEVWEKRLKDVEATFRALPTNVKLGHTSNMKPGQNIVIDGNIYANTPETLQLYSEYLNSLDRRDYWVDQAKQKRLRLKAEKFSFTDHLFSQRLQRRKAGVSQIPLDQIPDKVGRKLGGREFDNPYFKTDQNQYAGHPDGFPFTPDFRHEFELLEDALRRAGLPGFTLLYGGDVFSSGIRKQSYIAYAVDGRFAFRRSSLKSETFVDGRTRVFEVTGYDAIDKLKEYFGVK